MASLPPSSEGAYYVRILMPDEHEKFLINSLTTAARKEVLVRAGAKFVEEMLRQEEKSE